jgi:GT2 family glycosyltransferase
VPQISIVIPTLGTSESLHHVLAGLKRQKPPPSAVEVLVVADSNGLGDEADKLELSGSAFQLELIRSQLRGASAKRNLGWRTATAPLILFLDDDIVPGRNLVVEHLKWHERHPAAEIGVLGRVRWSRRVKVTPFMRWLEMGILFDYTRIEGTDAGWGRFYTCNASVKRAMLERVGGFDEQGFPFGYEDLEVAKRMAQHGFRLLYNGRAVGEHLKTETLESWRRNLRRVAVGERRFTMLYPEERPYFYERFRAAAAAPAARGRSARLARFIRPGVPWLGRVVWQSYDLVCLQRLAPEFLAEWEAADAIGGE